MSSSPIFQDKLKDFTENLKLQDLNWNRVYGRYVSKPLTEKEATKVANLISGSLALFGLQQGDVGIEKSETGSIHVIIANIPRFRQVLEDYEKKITPNVEQMKSSAIKEDTSQPDFAKALEAFTLEKFMKVIWDKRPSQYSTQPLEDRFADQIAETFGKDLKLAVGDGFGTINSSEGGKRVIIWNVDKFQSALEAYQKKQNELLSKMPKNVKEAEQFLNKFCDSNWNQEKEEIVKKLKERLNTGSQKFIDRDRYLNIKPLEQEGSYLLQTSSTHYVGHSGDKIWIAEKLISKDDIDFILSLLGKKA